MCRAPAAYPHSLRSLRWTPLQARAVSADGKVVVGSRFVERSGIEAFRWTAEEGVVGLGDLPGGDFDGEAFDVSADGTVIVGGSDSNLGGLSEAFRWTANTGLVGLGALPGGRDSVAYGISGDGLVVVGESAFIEPSKFPNRRGLSMDLGYRYVGNYH